jgi:hypothetical protein
VLGEELLDELELGELLDSDVPPAAPLELEDLLKWASHSAREICPSLFVSTSEKLGDDELDDEPPADDGLEADEDEGLDDEDGLVDDDGLDEDDEDCATASVESANITAAAVMPRALGMEFPLVGVGDGTCSRFAASLVPR